MENNSLDSIINKDNPKNKKDPIRFKLTLLKPKKKPKNPKKLDTSTSSNDNSILNYYTKKSQTTTDEYSLNEEDAKVEQLIFKTKRVKLVSSSEDTSQLMSEKYQGDETGKSALIKPAKIKNRSESEAPKNVFKKVVNSPVSPLGNLDIIRKSSGDSKQEQFVAKESKKKQRKLYTELVYDNIDLQKYTETYDGLETSETRNIKETVRAEEELIVTVPKKQRRKSCSHLIFDDTKMSNGLQRNQLISKGAKKPRVRLNSESVFDKTDLEEDNDGLNLNTESSLLKGQNEKQKATIKSVPKKGSTMKDIVGKDQNHGNSFDDLNRDDNRGEKHAKQSYLSDKQTKKLENKLTLNDMVMESDLSRSLLYDEGDKETFQSPKKQLKKRKRLESDSSQIKSPKKHCQKELNSSEVIADLTETNGINENRTEKDSDGKQLKDKKLKQRERKIKSKAIIDDDDNNTANDIVTPRVINDTAESSPLVVKQLKNKENLVSNKTTTTENVLNKTELVIKNLNYPPKAFDTTTANNTIEKTSISKDDKDKYAEYFEKNQFIAKQIEHQEITSKTEPILDNFTVENTPNTSNLRETNDNSSKKGATQKISKKIVKKGIESTESTLADEDAPKTLIDQQKKGLRPRLQSVKDTTPKIKPQNNIKDLSDVTPKSNEQLNTRLRPRSKSVIDTTPKIKDIIDENENSVEKSKKPIRSRLYSVKDTTPKMSATKLNNTDVNVDIKTEITESFNENDKLDTNSFSILDKADKHNSVESPKKRARPRADSVKDTTPRINVRPRLYSVKDITPKTSANIVDQNDSITTKELQLNHSDTNSNINRDIYEFINESSGAVATPDLLQPLDVQSIQKRKGGRPKGSKNRPKMDTVVNESNTSLTFDNDGKQNSVEPPKKRSRPRSDSVKDTTPRIKDRPRLYSVKDTATKTFGTIDQQNDSIPTKELQLSHSDTNSNINEEISEFINENNGAVATPDLLQPLDVQSVQKRKAGRPKGSKNRPKIETEVNESNTSLIFVKNEEQPKKRGRPRSYSVKDTTPRINVRPRLYSIKDTTPKTSTIGDQTESIPTNELQLNNPEITESINDNDRAVVTPDLLQPLAVQPIQKRKGGRPKGSKNLPKIKIESNESNTSLLLDNNDTHRQRSNSVKDTTPKITARPRLYSVKDTTPITSVTFDQQNDSFAINEIHINDSVTSPNIKTEMSESINENDKTEPSTFAIFDEVDKQGSVESPKKRFRPRSDSVKDTTPRVKTRPRLYSVKDTTSTTFATIVDQNDSLTTNELKLNNSTINSLHPINPEMSESINENNDLLQPVDAQPIQKRKGGRPKGSKNFPKTETTATQKTKLRPILSKTDTTTKTVPRRTSAKTTKINLAKTKIAILKPNGKITKESLKATSFRKIPQNRFEDALEMLRNEDHPVWDDHNISCNTGIHRYWEPRNCIKSDRNLKIKYARQFLLRRDWINLSRVLSLSTCNFNTNRNNHYYPLLTKYASLCLAHTDKEQFNKFLQFLVGMDDKASTTVMKKCTNIIKDTGE